MKKPVKNALFRVAEAFDLPADAVAGVARVEIVGAREIIVANHGGIIEYTPELVAVSGGEAIIEVHGVGFELLSMSASELSVRGRIFSVEFKY